MKTMSQPFNAFDSNTGPKKGHPEGWNVFEANEILSAVRDTLRNFVEIEEENIEVIYEHGLATLRGTIPSLTLKQRVEDELLALDGIDRIHNELRVGDALSEGLGEQGRGDRSGNPMVRSGSENSYSHPDTDFSHALHREEDGRDGGMAKV